MRRIAWVVSLMMILAACAPAGAPAAAVENATRAPTSSPLPATVPQPTASPLPTRVTTTPTPEIYPVIAVAAHVRGSTQAYPEIDAGGTAQIDLTFDPVNLAIERRADGTPTSYNGTNWEGAPLAQMRYCLAAGTGCAPPQAWQPYQRLVSVEVKVDWLGPRPFYYWAEFRDTQGKIVLASSQGGSALPKAQASDTLTVTGKVNPATPVAKLPPPVQTALVSTRSAYPVTGSVVINNGSCCAGGAAGSHISLKVAFQASSPSGSVKEMKVQIGGGCVKDPAQLTGSWEPFQPSRNYDAALALNWVGWWVSVQYRDAAGNLSPVYCDDISLEGSPPSPAP